MKAFARRLFATYSHNRDINCFFHGNKVMYSIPMHGRHEAAALGSTLNIEVDLDHIKPYYTLDIQSIGERNIKTTIAPYQDTSYLYEGCCPKK
jgi:hypothetical protein